MLLWFYNWENLTYSYFGVNQSRISIAARIWPANFEKMRLDQFLYLEHYNIPFLYLSSCLTKLNKQHCIAFPKPTCLTMYSIYLNKKHFQIQRKLYNTLHQPLREKLIFPFLRVALSTQERAEYLHHCSQSCN